MKWVTRASWGAAHSVGSSNPIPRDVYGLAVHYSESSVRKDGHTLCAAKVRAIQRYHQQTKGWADIAYSFVVCNHGFMFVGRGTAAGPASQGTNEGNLHYWSVCWLGDSRDILSDPAKAAVSELRVYLKQRGAGVALRPHSYFIATACPGQSWLSWIAHNKPVTQR
jgi:hypothetical protein